MDEKFIHQYVNCTKERTYRLISSNRPHTASQHSLTMSSPIPALPTGRYRVLMECAPLNGHKHFSTLAAH